MGGKTFTEEELKILRKNPCTKNATPKTLCFTEDFKEKFFQELLTGKSGRTILEENGYPADILGEERVRSVTYQIKKHISRKQGYDLGYQASEKQQRDDLKKEVKRLRNKVEYLENEIEFLKKITEIRNSRK